MIERALGGADAVQQLQDAEPAHFVARVLQHAQDGQHVLDVRRLQELQSAVFDERNIAARQLQLQQVAVVARAKQDGLLAERRALLAVLQDLLADLGALLGLVGAGEQHRPRAAGAHRPQVFGKPLARVGDDRVRDVQDRPRRAVVLLERDASRAREMAREIQDVAHGGGAKGVDRLRVVADHHQVAVRRAQRLEDLRLERVGVLVFVDQDVLELRAASWPAGVSPSARQNSSRSS